MVFLDLKRLFLTFYSSLSCPVPFRTCGGGLGYELEPQFVSYFFFLAWHHLVSVSFFLYGNLNVVSSGLKGCCLPFPAYLPVSLYLFSSTVPSWVLPEPVQV